MTGEGNLCRVGPEITVLGSLYFRLLLPFRRASQDLTPGEMDKGRWRHRNGVVLPYSMSGRSTWEDRSLPVLLATT